MGTRLDDWLERNRPERRDFPDTPEGQAAYNQALDAFSRRASDLMQKHSISHRTLPEGLAFEDGEPTWKRSYEVKGGR